jgi:hypothetical protein
LPEQIFFYDSECVHGEKTKGKDRKMTRQKQRRNAINWQKKEKNLRRTFKK